MIIQLKFEHIEAFFIAKILIENTCLKFELDTSEYCENTGDRYFNMVIPVNESDVHQTDGLYDLIEDLEIIHESDKTGIELLEARKVEKFKGNPFHGLDGKFATREKIAGTGGSKSIGQKKGKKKMEVTGSIEKDGKTTLTYGKTYNTGWGTKDPCGRAARRNSPSGDVTCSSGIIYKNIVKLKKKLKKMKRR